MGRGSSRGSGPRYPTRFNPQLISMPDTIATLALCALSVAAVLWDLKTRRIPNVLTASGLLIALLLRAVEGPAPLAAGVLAAGIGLGLSLPLVLAGALGGGDMKL